MSAGPLRYAPLVMKNVLRQRGRTILTAAGVATAMFLFAAVRALESGVAEATERTAEDTTLVVYRENRFCPFTSRLPEYYEDRIRDVPGVAAVTPMKVVVSNCRASLDVVTFRGVPRDEFAKREATTLTVLEGSLAEWLRRTDAALLGRTLAERRGLAVGDRFDANGVTVSVAAIFDSDEPQHRNVAYVDLDFLQRAPSIRQDGLVTQFNVRIDEPERLDAIAAEIDRLFEADQDPTHTRAEKAFVASAAADVLEIARFTSWLSFACIATVLALVANSIVLSVRDRVRDFAVMQTLGYTGGLVGTLVVCEGIVVALMGGLFGTGVAVFALALSDVSLSNEGLSIAFSTGPEVWAPAIVGSALLGALAGIVPAVRAARIPIAASFRAV